MEFIHVGWSAGPIRAGVGLRQGCSASPMLFRWALQDCLEPLRDLECRKNTGLSVDASWLTHLAGAGDTWLFRIATPGRPHAKRRSPRSRAFHWPLESMGQVHLHRRQAGQHTGGAPIGWRTPAPGQRSTRRRRLASSRSYHCYHSGWRRVQRREGGNPAKMSRGIPFASPLLEASRACHRENEDTTLECISGPQLVRRRTIWTRQELNEMYSMQLQMSRRVLGL